MSSVAEEIEKVWIAHTSAIDGIKKSLIYEPDTVDRANMPLLTMFFLLPQSVAVATGPEEEVSYAWEISLYVALASFKDAQAKMRDLSQLIIASFRQHRNDYDLLDITGIDADIFSRQLVRRIPPTPGEDNSYLRASWELQISSGEQ